MITNAHSALLELHKDMIASMRKDSEAPILKRLEQIKYLTEVEDFIVDARVDFSNPLMADDTTVGGAA